MVITVDVICEFIEPVVQLSTKQLLYRLEKVSGCAGEGRVLRLGVSVFTFSLEKTN